MVQMYIIAAFAVALIGVGVYLWRKQKTNKEIQAQQDEGVSPSIVRALERDYYRTYAQCYNCGYPFATYVLRGTGVAETPCPNCCAVGGVKAIIQTTDLSKVDLVIPDIPTEKVVEQVRETKVIKGSGKSTVFRR